MTSRDPNAGNVAKEWWQEGIGVEREETLVDKIQENPLQGVLSAATMFVPGAGRHPMEQKTPWDLLGNALEFTPLGDAKDLRSAVHKDSSLDWLERTLAAATVLPFVAGGVAVSMAAGPRIAAHRAQVAKNQRIEQGYQARQEAISSNEAQRWTGGDRPMQVSESVLPSAEELARIDAAQFEVIAQRFDESYERRQVDDAPWSLSETATFYDLALAHHAELGTVFDGPSDRQSQTYLATGQLRVLGEQLVSENPDWYGSAPAGAEGSHSLAAAQFALMRVHALQRHGAIVGPDGFDIFSDLGSLAILQIEQQAIKFQASPLGSIGPQGMTLGVTIDMNSGSPRAHLAVGWHNEIALNDGRVFNSETGDLNQAEMTSRLGFVDYNTLIGEMTANAYFSYSQASPEMIARGHDWYPGASRAAEYLASISQYDQRTVAALFSALSPQTAWVPDNFVGGIHAVLQYMPELETGSAAYRAHFVEAVRRSGHMDDLHAESSRKLRGEYTPEQLMEYYAHPKNAYVKGGRSIRKLMGVGNQDSKYEMVRMLLEYDLPVEVVLRMWKTHLFAHSINDPTTPMPVVIDRFQDHLLLGTVLSGEPLGSRGTQSYKNSPLFDAERGVYTFPWSGHELSAASLADIRGKLERRLASDTGAGRKTPFSQKDINRIMDRMELVPSADASARYKAGAMAHQFVAEIMGVTGNMVQAPTWAWTRELKKAWTKARKSGSKFMYDKALKEATFNSRIPLLLEGSTDVDTGVLGFLEQASMNAYPGNLPPRVPHGRGKHMTQGILMVADPAGGFYVFADLAIPAVQTTTRSLYPSGIEIDGYRQMMPRRPYVVSDHSAEANRVAAPGAEVTSRLPGEGHYGVLQGDRFVFTTSDPNSIVEAVSGLDRNVGVKVVPVSFDRQGLATARYGPADMASMTVEQLSDPVGSPLRNGEWAALTGFTGAGLDVDLAANAALRAELESMGYEPVPAVGRWGGVEGSAADAAAGNQAAADVGTFRDPHQEKGRVDPSLSNVEAKYMSDAGIDPMPMYVQRKWSEAQAVEMADALEAAPLFDKAALPAYEALKAETMAQFDALRRAGYSIEIVPPNAEYTPDSAAVTKRVREEKVLAVQWTEHTSGKAEYAATAKYHPLFKPAHATLSTGKPAKKQLTAPEAGNAKVTYKLSFNDIFRFVHDIHGHVTYRNQFGPLGEENAWRAHARMYSPLARRAMTAETRMQNSYVNAGPHMRTPDGLDQSIPLSQRPFAEQKVFLPDERFSQPDYAGQSESSLLVPGLSVADATRLGAKYGQVQVAHRRGMINVAEGTMHPASGEFQYGTDAITPDGYTQAYLPDGRRFPFRQNYDFESTTNLDADAQSTFDVPEGNMSEVVVELGDGASHLPWGLTDQIWDISRGTKPYRSAAYVSGSKWAPKNTHVAYESSIEGPGGTASVRSGFDPGIHVPHRSEVHVPTNEWAALDQSATGDAFDATASESRRGRWQLPEGFDSSRNVFRQAHEAEMKEVYVELYGQVVLDHPTGMPGEAKVSFDARGRIDTIELADQFLLQPAWEAVQELGGDVSRAKLKALSALEDKDVRMSHYEAATAKLLDPSPARRQGTTASFLEWESDFRDMVASEGGKGWLLTPDGDFPVEAMVNFNQSFSNLVYMMTGKDLAAGNYVPVDPRVKAVVDRYPQLPGMLKDVQVMIRPSEFHKGNFGQFDYKNRELKIDQTLVELEQRWGAGLASLTNPTGHFAKADRGVTVVEQTVVHEMAHAIHGASDHRNSDLHGYLLYRGVEMANTERSLGLYATKNSRELFSEVFTRVTFDPDAPRWMHELVEYVLTPRRS